MSLQMVALILIAKAKAKEMIKAKELLVEPHSSQRTSNSELVLTAWWARVSHNKPLQCRSMNNKKTLMPHLGSTGKIQIAF